MPKFWPYGKLGCLGKRNFFGKCFEEHYFFEILSVFHQITGVMQRWLIN